MSDFAGIDLAVGDVTGMRVWNIDAWGRLTGVTHPAVWTPGENVALCRRADASYVYYDREAPKCPGLADPSCGCGFWAYHYGGADHSGDVTGVVSGYGKTTIGEKGFRCEKARILAVCVEGLPLFKARLLARNYPDVVQYPSVDEMLAAHPLSDEYAPSPATTEDFWTRDISGASLTVSLTANMSMFSQAVNRYATSLAFAPSSFGSFELGSSPSIGERDETDRETALRNLRETERPARKWWTKW